MVDLEPGQRVEQPVGQSVMYSLRPEIWGAWSTVTVEAYRPRPFPADTLTVTVVPSRERVQLASGPIVDVKALGITGQVAGARYTVHVGEQHFQVKVTV